jgi:hypothetical protein
MSSDFVDKKVLAFADELIDVFNLGQESRAQLAERIEKFRRQVLTDHIGRFVIANDLGRC